MLNWNKVPRPELNDSWNMIKSEIDFYILEFRYYQDVIERKISEENNDFEEFAKKYKTQNFTDETIENNKKRLINFFRKSFLVQILSMTENQLRIICQLVESYNYQKFSIRDLKGTSDFEKAKIYLKKTIEIEFNKLNPEWNIIINYQALRNIIVHNQSSFSENDKKTVKKFIDQNQSLIDTPHYFDIKKKELLFNFEIVDKEFNIKLIDIVESFFNKLFDYLYNMNIKNKR